MIASNRLTQRSAGEIAAYSLSCALAVLGFLLYFAPLGAASALPLCAILAVWMAVADNCLDLRQGLTRLLIFVPLLSYMFLSAGWAIDRPAALWLATRLSAIAIAAILLIRTMLASPPKRRRLFILCFAIGLAASSSVVAIDLLTGTRLAIGLHGIRDPAFGPNSYSRGTVFAAISAVAICVGLWRGYKTVAVLTFLTVTAAVLLGSQLSAKIALLVSVLVTLLVLQRPGIRWLMPQLLIVIALTVPFWLPSALPQGLTCWLGAYKPSALHRIFIWNFVAEHVHQKPFFGWGLDAARRLPGGTNLVPIRNCLTPNAMPIMGQLLPLHPHNGILQVWLELGAVGAVLAFGGLALCIALALKNRASAGKSAMAAIAGTIAAILAVGLFSFGVWQEWWLSAAVFSCAVAMTASGLAGEPQAQRSSRSTST